MKRILQPIKCELEVIVRDKHGNVIQTEKLENDLLLRWSLRYLYGELMNINVTLKDEGGSFRSSRFDYRGSSEFHWRGKIAIGLDNTPPSMDDYKLGAKYMETTTLDITTLTEKDSSAEFEISADFTFTVAKDIWEVGLFGGAHDGNSSYTFLVARDVFSPAVSVPEGGILTIKYKFILGTVA